MLWIDNITVRTSAPLEIINDGPDPCLFYRVRDGRLVLQGVDLDQMSNKEIYKLLKSRQELKQFLHELPKGGAPKGNTNTKIDFPGDQKKFIINDWKKIRHQSRLIRDTYAEKIGVSTRTLQRWLKESKLS